MGNNLKKNSIRILNQDPLDKSARYQGPNVMLLSAITSFLLAMYKVLFLPISIHFCWRGKGEIKIICLKSELGSFLIFGELFTVTSYQVKYGIIDFENSSIYSAAFLKLFHSRLHFA